MDLAVAKMIIREHVRFHLSHAVINCSGFSNKRDRVWSCLVI